MLVVAYITSAQLEVSCVYTNDQTIAGIFRSSDTNTDIIQGKAHESGINQYTIPIRTEGGKTRPIMLLVLEPLLLSLKQPMSPGPLHLVLLPVIMPVLLPLPLPLYLLF